MPFKKKYIVVNVSIPYKNYKKRMDQIKTFFREKMLISLFLLLAVIPPCNPLVAGETEDSVIAEGNGFRLTEADVRKIKEFYDKTPMRSSEAEYHIASFKIKLLAHEAIVEKIDKKLGIPPEDLEKVESWLKLDDACYKSILEKYPVSDLVIESYYRAFPDRFCEEGSELKANLEQKPIDNDTKKQVREIILNAENTKILAETILKLKKKYNINFVGKYKVFDKDLNDNV